MNKYVIDQDSPSVQYLSKNDKRLAKVISCIGKIEYSIPDDPYQFLVEHIVGQMLSNKVAFTICERLKERCQGRISADSITGLTDEQLLATGVSRPKIKYIRRLTELVETNELMFDEFCSMNDEDVLKALTSVSGIGNWTAKMYLLFLLNRDDVLPFEDGAFLQAYKWLYKTDEVSKEAIQKKCKKWKPYSSIASRYMYKALDSGLTKKEFHLYK